MKDYNYNSLFDADNQKTKDYDYITDIIAKRVCLREYAQTL